MQTINEIYSTAILPLSEEERLKLAEMHRSRHQNARRGGEPHRGSLRSAFGTWQGGPPALIEYDKLDHNEKIDFDLARSYIDTHDDEN